MTPGTVKTVRSLLLFLIVWLPVWIQRMPHPWDIIAGFLGGVATSTFIWMEPGND